MNDSKEIAHSINADPDVSSSEAQDLSLSASHLQRRLGGKEVQLFAIGGAIGTSMSCDNSADSHIH
jgi:amino acid permease